MSVKSQTTFQSFIRMNEVHDRYTYNIFIFYYLLLNEYK